MSSLLGESSLACSCAVQEALWSYGLKGKKLHKVIQLKIMSASFECPFLIRH